MLANGCDEASVFHLDDPVVVEDVIADLVWDALDCLAPGLSFVRGDSQDWPAIVVVVLAKVEECDGAIIEAQQA